jgi:hypothetical protein
VSAVSTSTRGHRYLHYDVFTDTAQRKTAEVTDSHTDAWRRVEMVPARRDRKLGHMASAHPSDDA